MGGTRAIRGWCWPGSVPVPPPFHGMMNLGGVHANVSNCHAVSKNAADLDGVAVNHPNYLDYGWITLGCDKSREQGEEGS